jgi:hypothetical protein
MAAIVYLDVDDEITSAAARIRGMEDERIALVLPLGSRLATSRINFRLLAREAEARGKRIEVVTNDASARALAASAGLPTHLSVAAFEAGPAAAREAGDAHPEGGSGAGGDSDAGPAAGSGDTVVAAAAAAAAPGTPARVRVDDDSPTTAIPAIRRPAEHAAPLPQVGRRPPRPMRPILVAVLLVVGLLTAGVTAAFLLLPSAEITLTPATERIGPLELNVTAQSGVTRPDVVNLLVPATRFTFDVEATETFAASGVKVTETIATGEVTFSSLNTGNSNKIDKGAIVETESGIEFRTVAEVNLPPAEIGIVDGKFVVIPSTEKVGVEAVAPGLSGNVAAGTIVVVPKEENPQRTTVTNDAATAGGSHTETPQVQQADIDAALRALDLALGIAFDEQIASRAEVPDGTILFPETKVLGESTPSVDPATLVGLDAADFELGLAAQGTVLGADPGPVATLAEARIRSAVDDGFRLVEESIVIEDGQPIVAGTAITFPVTVRATEIRIVDTGALLARVRGLGLPQARTVLQEYGTVQILVWPDWVTSIPTAESRATLTIAEPSSAPASPEASSPGGASPP